MKDIINLRTEDNKRYFFADAENFKTRDDDGNPIIEGYFAVFNTET